MIGRQKPIDLGVQVTDDDVIKWRGVRSSNVEKVGWGRHGKMYVVFEGGALYAYEGVTRQRVVAAAHCWSVGSYIAKKIKPKFQVTKLA